MPLAPTYDESQAVYSSKSLESNYTKNGDGQGDGDRWISGFHETHRRIAIVYNPNPTGAVNQLDERVSSFAPGVGVYEWRMVAEEVCAFQIHIGFGPIPVTLIYDDQHTDSVLAVAYRSLAIVPLHTP